MIDRVASLAGHVLSLYNKQDWPSCFPCRSRLFPVQQTGLTELLPLHVTSFPRTTNMIDRVASLAGHVLSTKMNALLQVCKKKKPIPLLSRVPLNPVLCTKLTSLGGYPTQNHHVKKWIILRLLRTEHGSGPHRLYLLHKRIIQTLTGLAILIEIYNILTHHWVDQFLLIVHLISDGPSGQSVRECPQLSVRSTTASLEDLKKAPRFLPAVSACVGNVAAQQRPLRTWRKLRGFY